MKIIFAFLGLLLSITPPSFSALNNHDLLSLTNKSLPDSTVGIVVMNAQSGQVIYQKNANKNFTPASITKLFTATASLMKLGDQFQFTTGMSIQASQLKNNVLHGNLYINFSGDPSFSISNLNALIAQTKKYGIHQIKGNIILVNPFTNQKYPLGMMQSDTPYCFATPASGISINHNCFYLTLKNGNVTNGLSEYIHSQSHVTMANANALKYCVFQPHMNDQNQLTLDGCLPNRKEWSFNMAVQHPSQLVKAALHKLLKQNHIQLDGKIIVGKAPKDLKIIAIHHSVKLPRLLKHMLTYSDNLYANALTRTLGKRVFDVGSYTGGISVINEALKPILGSKLTLEDGAGVSYYNAIQPEQVIKLLHYIYLHPKLAKVLIPSLPISGETGTLKARMKDDLLKGKVFAKTGSMQGVSNLAGFILLPNKIPLAFVIMMNGVHGSLNQARQVQDQLVEKIPTLYSFSQQNPDTLKLK